MTFSIPLYPAISALTAFIISYWLLAYLNSPLRQYKKMLAKMIHKGHVADVVLTQNEEEEDVYLHFKRAFIQVDRHETTPAKYKSADVKSGIKRFEYTATATYAQRNGMDLIAIKPEIPLVLREELTKSDLTFKVKGAMNGT